MGYADDTMAEITREAWEDWQTRYEPVLDEMLNLEDTHQLMTDQLGRVTECCWSQHGAGESPARLVFFIATVVPDKRIVCSQAIKQRLNSWFSTSCAGLPDKHLTSNFKRTGIVIHLLHQQAMCDRLEVPRL